jgi:hypothetical protein
MNKGEGEDLSPHHIDDTGKSIVQLHMSRAMPYPMRCVFIFARHPMRYEKKDCHVKNTAEGVGRECRGPKWTNMDGNGCPIAVRQVLSRRRD